MAKSDMSDSEEDGKKTLETQLGCGTSKNKVKTGDFSTRNSSESLCVANFNPNNIPTNSILVAALLKTLTRVFENDREQADKNYKDLCDKLFRMNMIDESYKNEEYDSIIMQLQYILFQHSSFKGRALPIEPVWPDENLATSHYYREFEEISFIAGGGFGKVYKVRHKLDGIEYAVKKIPIRADGLDQVKNYLSECKTFASINHPNVVQYKAAWFDMGTSGSGDTLTDHDDYDDDDFTSRKTTNHQEYHLSQEYVYNNAQFSSSFPVKPEEDSSDFQIVFESSLTNVETVEETFGKRKKSGPKRTKRCSVSEGGNALCPLDLREIEEIRTRRRRQERWATLYIQMALCQSTLKQWLERRNRMEGVIDPMKALVPIKIVQDSVVREILVQLLDGLQYIHFKKIVHHDIKPSNIFLQTDNGKLLVQFGDFGLACPLQSVRHTLAFGTKLYAAPEQLEGQCNPKSDLYSLGIVLFELVETFTTDMERCKYIEELKKKGTLPPRVEIQHPQFADIITRLVRKSPQERPTAIELLNEINKSVASCDLEVNELKNQISEKDKELLEKNQEILEMGQEILEKDKEISEKDKELSEKDKEILRLKELLKSAGVVSNGN